MIVLKNETCMLSWTGPIDALTIIFVSSFTTANMGNRCLYNIIKKSNPREAFQKTLLIEFSIVCVQITLLYSIAFHCNFM